MTYLEPGSCYRVGCEKRAVGRFCNAWLCAGHAPSVPVPDPARTYAALTAACGWRSDFLSPWAVKGGSDILKERPGGYVSRQRAERIGAGTAPRQHR